jgi:predicted negative regulator of RcsB-dependent stress response
VADYLSDEEQAERIKQWLRENGISMVATVVLGVGAVWGWNAWKGHQHEQSVNASVQFEQLNNALAQLSPASPGSAESVKSQAQALIEQSPKSQYADFARLALARTLVMQGDFDGAVEPLQAVVDNPATAEAGHTATLRLARLQLQRGDLEAAAALLEADLPEAFQAQALEVEGDLYLAREDAASARDAYASALEAMEAGDPGRRRVQMKLNDLAVAS